MPFAAATPNAIPLTLVPAENWDQIKATLPPADATWADVNGFTGGAGQVVAVAGSEGSVKSALIGLGTDTVRKRRRFASAAGFAKLPAATFEVANAVDTPLLEEFALGWLLDGYRFDRYRAQPPRSAQLIAPAGIDTSRLEAIANGEFLTRDLINTPSSDMGPDELEAAAKSLASEFGANIEVIHDQELLDQNFPMIHTVGRASTRRPRLIDMRWGSTGPKLTLVGKGVCFDTGGLNLKPGASMSLMKKDMGGSAMVLGLSRMIMALGMDIQLRVLIPAVENSVSGNAFRPQDILTSRKGLTVEINNTDAEGRLVLADALTYACEEDTDLVISMATLTGAARVAVGGDLAPFFCDSDQAAQAISQGGKALFDPVWRMPFHDPYENDIEPGIADLDNAPGGGFAGAITAALFLRRFVDKPYIHFDCYGWNRSPAPALPKGGIGQGTRALLDALPTLLAK